MEWVGKSPHLGFPTCRYCTRELCNCKNAQCGKSLSDSVPAMEPPPATTNSALPSLPPHPPPSLPPIPYPSPQNQPRHHHNPRTHNRYKKQAARNARETPCKHGYAFIDVGHKTGHDCSGSGRDAGIDGELVGGFAWSMDSVAGGCEDGWGRACTGLMGAWVEG